MFNLRNGSNILESKDSLYEALKDYKWLMSNEAYSYLEALIGLDVSVFNSSTPDTKREILRKLDLYKKIAIYNACMHTTKFLNENSNGITLCSLEENSVNPIYFRMHMHGNIDGKNFPLFSFNVETDNPFYIGDADIYSTKINDELRQEEITRLTKELEIEKNKDNPYAIHDGIQRINEEDASRWEAIRKMKIDNLTLQIAKLKSHQGLNKKSLRVISTQNEFYNLLLKDMNLEETDFTPIQSEGMKRTLTKKYPGMSIRTNIENV